MAHGANLPRKREQAIAALLSEPTVLAAAARTGVCERTLRTWMADPGFVAELRKARKAVLEQAITLATQATTPAVAVLIAALGAEKDADKIKAATALLDRVFGSVHMADVETVEKAAELLAARQSEPSANDHAIR